MGRGEPCERVTTHVACAFRQNASRRRKAFETIDWATLDFRQTNSSASLGTWPASRTPSWWNRSCEALWELKMLPPNKQANLRLRSQSMPSLLHSAKRVSKYRLVILPSGHIDWQTPIPKSWQIFPERLSSYLKSTSPPLGLNESPWGSKM